MIRNVRGVRTAAWVVVGLCLGAPAQAQFPFFSSEAKGPDVRIASRDPLHDEIARFLVNVEAVLAEAEAEVRSLEAEPAVPPGTAQSSVDLRRGLLTLARQRVQHLTSARATALRARDVVQSTLPRPAPTELGRLVSLARTASRLDAARWEAERHAERLEAVAMEGARVPRGVRETAEREVQVARARAARAQAFEARAQARRGAQIAEAARAMLQLSPRAEAAARAQVTDVEARLRRLEAEPIPESEPPVPPAGTSSLARPRFEQEALTLDGLRAERRVRRVRSAEAELLAARALVWGYDALIEGPVARPRALDAEALSARVLGIEDERSRRVETIAALRRALEGPDRHQPWSGLLEAQIRVLDEALTAVLDEERWAEEALATVDVVERVQRDKRARPGWQSGLLVVLALLCGFMALRYGGHFLAWLLAPGLGWLRLSEKAATRAQAIASLLWPLAVGVGTAAVIVWPVLGLELTVFEALEVLERPLFYVEDTGVSVLSVGQFVLTIWAAIVISRLVRSFLTDRLYARTSWDIGLTNALDTMVHYVVLLVGVVLGLRFVGVGLSSLAILAGVLGIGIGFGLRNITENFISGLIILAERPIKIGDFIEVKEGEVEGRVESIRARSTTVITRDNISMIIPNSEFVARPVVNWSHGDPKVRVAIPVGVAYGSDTDLVRKVLLEVAGRHGQVLKKPSPEVQFRAFGSSSLDFLLLVWIEEQMHRFRIASDLHFAIDKAFRKRGIEIAFPQLDLHLKSMYPAFASRLHEVPSPPPLDEGPKIPDRKSILSRSPTARPTSKSGPSAPAGEDADPDPDRD